VEVAWEVVPAALALGPGDEQHPSQDQTADGRRYAGLPIEAAVERLNPVLRGWGNYFRHGNSARKFAQIDSYVHERLAILAANKHGLSGRKWLERINSAWLARLGVHTLQGTINYGTANASR
jgi:RNA-directed DNA polymerase